jgi:hypothetical protein
VGHRAAFFSTGYDPTSAFVTYLSAP